MHASSWFLRGIRMMRAFVHESTDRFRVVLRAPWRRPHGLLTTAASVSASNHTPAMTTWRLDYRPTLVSRILQRGFDFFVGMPRHGSFRRLHHPTDLYCIDEPQNCQEQKRPGQHDRALRVQINLVVYGFTKLTCRNCEPFTSMRFW